MQLPPVIAQVLLALALLLRKTRPHQRSRQQLRRRNLPHRHRLVRYYSLSFCLFDSLSFYL